MLCGPVGLCAPRVSHARRPLPAEAAPHTRRPGFCAQVAALPHIVSVIIFYLGQEGREKTVAP